MCCSIVQSTGNYKVSLGGFLPYPVLTVIQNSVVQGLPTEWQRGKLLKYRYVLCELCYNAFKKVFILLLNLLEQELMFIFSTVYRMHWSTAAVTTNNSTCSRLIVDETFTVLLTLELTLKIMRSEPFRPDTCERQSIFDSVNQISWQCTERSERSGSYVSHKQRI